MPSSPVNSSDRRPEEATSACPPKRAAQVKITKMTTAMVTNCEFRKVRPSKYIATARLPSIADLRLHMVAHSPIQMT